MNEIDWSKAPEGATHYVVGSIHPFEKRVGDAWFYYVGGAWSSIHRKGDDRITSSALAVVPRPTTPSWSGEGLPPVGTVCEIAESTDVLKISYPAGSKVKIYAHFTHVSGREIAAFADDAAQIYGCGYYRIFKPIRTPEQIAADEREAAIDEMLAATPAPGSDISLRVCERLYDAGYRKP